jgi:hypothetical protein
MVRVSVSAVILLSVVIAVWFACVFSLPLPYTVGVLFFLLVISPAVWIVGTVYARGSRQAFFLCGLIVGVAPHLTALWYGPMMIGLPTIFDVFNGGEGLASLDSTEQIMLRGYMAIWWLLPGVISVSAGLLGALTHRLLVGKPARNPAPGRS